MAQFAKTELILDHKFDPKTCRHFVNGEVVVLHCHHYATLYAQLADDLKMLDGKKLLAECAEDTFFEILSNYYTEHGIESVEEKISIAEQYFAATGLGKMRIIYAGKDSGEVELIHSHIDEGWIKKWGKRDKPVNFMSCGYIAATFAATFDLAPRSYKVEEIASIVSGAPLSRFNVVIN